MADLLGWMEGTALATWTRESPSLWAYPLILTLHSIGLGFVVGASVVLDLRLLGYGRAIQLPALMPLFRVIWLSFGVNAASGLLLFVADATRKAAQPVFYVKLACIALALVNTAMVQRVIAGSAEEPVAGTLPPQHRTLAALSLTLWLGAITAGRLMAYF